MESGFAGPALGESAKGERSVAIMASRQAALKQSIVERFRRLCLALPETSEKSSWGHPNFCAGKRIFAVCEVFQGRPAFAFKLEHADQEALLGDPRFYRTPYVGHRG